MVSDAYYLSLISSIRKQRIIYDRSHPDYRSVRKRNDAWKVVTETLFKRGFSPDDVFKCRDRWKNLGQRYRSALQFGPKFAFSSEMRFLDDYLDSSSHNQNTEQAVTADDDDDEDDEEEMTPVNINSKLLEIWSHSGDQMRPELESTSLSESQAPNATRIVKQEAQTLDKCESRGCAHCDARSGSPLDVKDLASQDDQGRCKPPAKPEETQLDQSFASNLESKLLQTLDSMQEFISGALRKEHERVRNSGSNEALFQCIDHLTADMSPVEQQEAVREMKRACVTICARVMSNNSAGEIS